jgi:hypothetical protein
MIPSLHKSCTLLVYCSPFKVRITGTSPGPATPKSAAAAAAPDGKRLLTPDITFVVLTVHGRTLRRQQWRAECRCACVCVW